MLRMGREGKWNESNKIMKTVSETKLKYNILRKVEAVWFILEKLNLYFEINSRHGDQWETTITFDELFQNLNKTVLLDFVMTTQKYHTSIMSKIM